MLSLSHRRRRQDTSFSAKTVNEPRESRTVAVIAIVFIRQLVIRPRLSKSGKVTGLLLTFDAKKQTWDSKMLRRSSSNQRLFQKHFRRVDRAKFHGRFLRTAKIFAAKLRN
jgi:hypothetical protein